MNESKFFYIDASLAGIAGEMVLSDLVKLTGDAKTLYNNGEILEAEKQKI